MGSQSQEDENSGHGVILGSRPRGHQPSLCVPWCKGTLKWGCRFLACCKTVQCGAEAGPCRGSPRPF